MYAQLACETGWTWEYIGQCMTLPRLFAMQTHWKAHPPVAALVAAYVGYKAPSEPVPTVTSDASNDAVIRNIRSMQK